MNVKKYGETSADMVKGIIAELAPVVGMDANMLTDALPKIAASSESMHLWSVFLVGLRDKFPGWEKASRSIDEQVAEAYARGKKEERERILRSLEAKFRAAENETARKAEKRKQKILAGI